MLKYSIVVPLHNEQENVTDLYARLKSVMEANGEPFEVVFVDDGSSDGTFPLLREIAAVDSRVTVVKLRRNFGQTAGLAAGFDHARGEYIIAMDGDLQHDPADIPMFLEKIAEGYDIVSGWRKNRVDNFWMRRIPSRCANWLMAKLSGADIHDFGTTFKAYRREILEQVPLYGELHRFIPALASWHGATIVEVPIKNVNRERGVSHYGISRTFRVFFDLITIRFLLRYLARPLHFFGTIGMLSNLAGIGIAILFHEGSRSGLQFPTLVEDLSGYTQQNQVPIRAILGVNFLRRAHVTFANDGSVSAVDLEPPFLDNEIGRCVGREMQRASITAYAGAPVTVVKTFDVR